MRERGRGDEVSLTLTESHVSLVLLEVDAVIVVPVRIGQNYLEQQPPYKSQTFLFLQLLWISQNYG